ncbi:hypothetical protein EGH24_06185 [Halonotius terrestris]|uniref:DUF5305 domain-containing protein n=1 Tax=Halonotius terrestris TaxID=2487750 RepID=A0A8J8PD51_9EURY|nr:DUF5305 family protein [Halonotius terrestris]TQQ83017.1 hypothetical protein EGH24_06185 [Halonotius terrestris]
MAEIDRSLTFRSFLNDWFVVILIALAIAALLSGWWAYQVNLVPDIEEEQRLSEQWSESTSFRHSAYVEQESIPFPAGETVANRPIYYTNISDELDGTYRYQYSADSGTVDVETETFLLIRGGELEDGNLTETFWEVSEPLASGSDTIEPGEAHTVQFTVDIRSVLTTIATVEQQLDSSDGIVDVRVVSLSDVSGTAEGETLDETYRSELIMVVSPSTYRVAETNTVDEVHRSFETVEVLAEPSPIVAYGSIVLFGVVVMLLMSVVGLRYTGYTELTDEEEELLEITSARQRFSEWITTGEFPSEREYEQTVLVDDLEGLVDVAIDTNKRVIEDTQLGVFTVLDDAYIYIYIRPDSAARDWLVNYADTTIDEFDEYDF